MTDKEKIISFENYLRAKNIDNQTVVFYVNVVNLLVSEVLFYFDETLESIDTYCFEEFTDMIRLIEKEFGGRDGIPKITAAMLELTEFLKINKFIKGGKIAYYKRMFSNLDYYLDKYDMMTGKKDDSKEFIRYAIGNSFSENVIIQAEEINLYDILTLNRVDKLLNDVPFTKKEMCDDIRIIREILIDLKLLEDKNGQLEATKKGRAISRLSIEERYAALLYLFLYTASWNNVISKLFGGRVDIDTRCIFKIFSSIFSSTLEVPVKLEDITKTNEKELIIEISKPSFRIAKAEALLYGTMIIDICLVGFGLVDIQNNAFNQITYKANNFSQSIFKQMLKDYSWNIRTDIEEIGYLIKNKNYEKAEQSVINYITTYGNSIIVWDYLGQLLLLKKDYEIAYIVLKHAYETSSKKGRNAKSVLYHLVLCCRKLKLSEDIKSYEQKLQGLEKI